MPRGRRGLHALRLRRGKLYRVELYRALCVWSHACIARRIARRVRVFMKKERNHQAKVLYCTVLRVARLVLHERARLSVSEVTSYMQKAKTALRSSASRALCADRRRTLHVWLQPNGQECQVCRRDRPARRCPELAFVGDHPTVRLYRCVAPDSQCSLAAASSHSPPYTASLFALSSRVPLRR